MRYSMSSPNNKPFAKKTTINTSASNSHSSESWWLEQAKTKPSHKNVPETVEIAIAGVTFEGRQQILARLTQGETVYLVREPSNQYDRNAIRITRGNGEVLGYVPKTTAASLASGLEQYGKPVEGTISAIVGDISAGNYLGARVRFIPPAPIMPDASNLDI